MNRLDRLRLLALAAAGMGFDGVSLGLDEDALAAWVDRAALWVLERVHDARWGAWAETWLDAYSVSDDVETSSERSTVSISVRDRAPVAWGTGPSLDMPFLLSTGRQR